MRYKEALVYARELRKSQTGAEKVFWSNVRNKKFHGFKFNRQFIIEYQNGSYFIVDFYCHQHKLIIELDGEIHNTQKEYDFAREQILVEMGFTVVRFRNRIVLEEWDSVEKRLVKELSPNPSL